MRNLPKVLVFGLIVVAASLFLSACTRDPAEVDGCYADGKEIEGNTDLQAILVDNSDNSVVEKTEITLEETEGFGFGMDGVRGEEDYYGTYELCNLDTGEVLHKGEYVFENYTLFEKATSPDVQETTGNTTSFVYEVEGKKENSVFSPGKYAVSTFSASEGGEWKLSDTFEFTVVE